jgi:hypothetical protein
VNRVTSYSRSSTIARIDEEDLKAIREAGLDRVHVGLESGSDNVLKRVKKGATKAIHVSAGLKAKSARLELSEYIMPGLGGVRLSEEHALETADALNQINPDFIRLRQLAIPIGAPLSKDLMEGRFEMCSDPMVAGEVLTLIESLNGITSVVKSDHILNLFSEVEGTLPEDKERMLEPLRTFLSMESEKYCERTDEALYLKTNVMMLYRPRISLIGSRDTRLSSKPICSESRPIAAPKI